MEVSLLEEINQIAHEYGFPLTQEDAAAYLANVSDGIAAIERNDALHASFSASSSRGPCGYLPAPQDNRLHAWAWKASIRETDTGPLAGKRIAIKDNVAVAGLPLRNGSTLLEGLTSSEDASVVSRILAAGGEIAGKAVCEDLCFSGGSHTSQPHPVLNPHHPDHMSGGSSSGCAVLVATGECDAAIGGDQGGSIRIPSSWCGIYGLKPTWGLVPYTGAFPIEPSMDHLGPMARNVEDLASLFDVIAGRDGLDARQFNTPFSYPAVLPHLNERPPLKIGILQEGFGWPGASDARVDERIRMASRVFSDTGLALQTISAPLHLHALDIWTGAAVEGAWSTMVRGNGVGHGQQGRFDEAQIGLYAQARRQRAQEYSATVKSTILLAEHLDRRHGGKTYARAQNLRRVLRAAYDKALSEVDLLLMPTTPCLPPPLPTDGATAHTLAVALNMMHNTAAFDASGHPAINVPCGRIDGLPAGMMLVGRHFDERSLLQAARLFEQSGFDARMQ